MIDTILQEFHYTSQFLGEKLGTEIYGVHGQQMMNELLDHLQLDGFDLRTTPDCYNHQSRLLSLGREAVEDEELVFNLTFVVFCVVCAGLASGLTQV